MDEQLNCSLTDLHLHPQQGEFRTLSQMQRGVTSRYAKGGPPSLQKPVAECPPLGPVQKQV